MYLSLIKCLQLILIVVNCHLSWAYSPTMTPNTKEIYINEGDSLEITCQSFDQMNFYYPNSSKHQTTSPVNLEQIHMGIYEIKFQRSNTVYGDTGWYGCADNNVHVTPDNYTEPNVTWTYVFVKSNKSAFVDDEIFHTLHHEAGDSVLINCRTTSLDYNIELLSDNDDVIDIRTRGSFDPKKGFIIDNITMSDGGSIKCQVEMQDDEVQTMLYYLTVLKKHHYIPKPIIEEETFNYVVQGQELRINCSVDVESDMFYVLEWTYPHNNTRFTSKMYKVKLGKNLLTAIQELTIKNITYEDEGYYECTLTTFSKKNSTKKFIKIYDPSKKFIKLTSASDEINYRNKIGSEIIWIVNIAGYPPPEIRWLGPHNETIITNYNKYVVNKTWTRTSLKIRDLVMSDMGVYTIEAESKDEKNPQIQRLHFNLTIISEPLVMEFENIKPYYELDEVSNFLCEIAAYPQPNVTWSFEELFFNTATHEMKIHSEPKIFKNFSNKIVHSQMRSTLTMKINTSGILTCRACNEMGCHEYSQPILVSDVPNGFGIVSPNKDITEGDNLELICGASIYNYTNSVEWEIDQDSKELLMKTKKLNIIKKQTPFTYQTILYINNIKMSDEDTLYNCTAMCNDGTIRQETKRLMINEAIQPYFTRVNLNETEIVYDSETAHTTIITLECYVSGMPPPIISWWKDDERIDESQEDLYVLANNNQELEIKHPSARDSGEYSCVASNRLNSIRAYQRVTINGEKVSEVLIISIIILLIICVILVIYFSIKIHREKVMRKQLMEAGLTHFEEGALECLNPELTVDDQAELLPYDKKWEFPREKLKFGKQLGCGAFGVVMKAEAQGICENEGSTTVAVKMVRRSTESTYIRALASELKIMVHLGKHLNVVNLLGACTRNIAKRELLVIVEYCRFGNLHNYLLRHRSDFVNQIDPATGKIDPSIGRELLMRSASVGSNNSISMNSNSGPELVSYTAGSDSQGINTSPDGMILSNNSIQPGWRSNYRGDYKDQNLKPICTQDLLSWAFQVARGMEYLSQRKVLHGDLAARNILLAENNIVKICDFGLAKTMYKDENYKKKGDAPLPIKWMAIESIRDRVFSTQSDIWSFGIVLWEFFTLAETPYPGMEAEKQYQKLIEGYRMENPEFSTNDVYDIMLQCWKAKPISRPTFTDLVQSIGNLLEESARRHYLDLNTPYMDMNAMIFENGKNDYLTMMSSPNHETLSSPTVREYVNSPNIPISPATETSYICMTPVNPKNDTEIFSPRHVLEQSHFNFPSLDAKSTINSDSESEAVELSPMLKNDDDNYLKPINVQERRAEFARQQKAMRNAIKDNKLMERDSGYCNAPQNLRIFETHDDEINDKVNKNNTNFHDEYDKRNSNNYLPGIIRTQDNYINMPKHKNDLKKDTTDSFTNPSYIYMANRENDENKV